MAPGASLLNLRVLGDDGSGSASDVIEAIDWAIDHTAQYNIRIINLSLGAPVLQSYRDDPMCEAVERAVARRASSSWRRRAITGRRRTARSGSGRSRRPATARTR